MDTAENKTSPEPDTPGENSFTDLVGLLGSLKAMKKQKKTQSQIIKRLFDVGTECNIRVCVDNVTSEDSDTTSYSIDPCGNVIIFYNQMEKLSLIEQEKIRVHRIILSCKKWWGEWAKPQLWFDCNGVVIDANTWKPLSVPPRSLNMYPKKNAVDAFLRKGLYDIFEIDDGTVVTFYNWKHPKIGKIWCIATGNGYDVSTLCWMGAKTYAEVIYETAEKFPEFCEKTAIRLVKDGFDQHRLDFDLDENRSYTFGIRNHIFHPFLRDPEKMWFIQSVDLTDPALEPIVDEDLGIPIQRHVVDNPPRTVEEIKARCDLVPNLADEGERIFYGYILRSRDRELTRGESEVLFSSRFLNEIRYFMYKKPPKSIRADVYVSGRLDYVCMNAFLQYEPKKERFLEIFPQFRERFHAYALFMENVAKMVLDYYRTSVIKKSEPGLKNKSSVAILAYHLFKFMKGNSTINPFLENAERTVLDFMRHPDYTLMFVKAFSYK